MVRLVGAKQIMGIVGNPCSEEDLDFLYAFTSISLFVMELKHAFETPLGFLTIS